MQDRYTVGRNIIKEGDKYCIGIPEWSTAEDILRNKEGVNIKKMKKRIVIVKVVFVFSQPAPQAEFILYSFRRAVVYL